MIWHRAALALAIVLPLCTGGLVPIAAADDGRSTFELGSWAGLLDAEYDQDRQQSRTGVTQDVRSKFHRSQESATITNSGFSLIDESILTGDMSLTIGRFQDGANVTGGPEMSDHGSLVGYGLSSYLFGLSPLNAFVHASRAETFMGRSFGHTQSIIENQGAEIRLTEDSLLARNGVPFFSSNLHLDRTHVTQETRNALGGSFALEEVRRGLAYEGHKGFVRADLNWNYSLQEVSDAGNPLASVRQTSLGVRHSVDFGPTYNWRLSSGAGFARSETVNGQKSGTLDERLHADHWSNLSSDYSWTGTRIEAPNGVTTNQGVSASLNHVLEKNLNTSLQVTGNRMKMPTGSFVVEGGRLQFGYRHSLPESGGVFSQASAGILRHENRLTSSLVNVIDESHAAPATLGTGNGFTLGQPYAASGTIVVIDARGGARHATTQGVDYVLDVSGGVVRILPLVTSVVIQPGDPLLVSYSYQVDPSITYRTNDSSLSLGASYGIVTISLSQAETTQRIESGQEIGFLDESNSTSAAVDLHGALRSMQLQGGVSFRRFNSTRLYDREYRVYETTQYRPRYDTSFGLTANYTRTDFPLLLRQSTAASLNLTYFRISSLGWTTEATLAHRVFSETSQATEKIDEANVDEGWTYGKFSLRASLGASRQQRDAFRTIGWHMHISMLREF